MNRSLPALTEALEDWRDIARDRAAADSLLDFKGAQQRYKTLRDHLEKLRANPPQFDLSDLKAILDLLQSAQRQRNLIAEGNEIELLIPILRAFLYDTPTPDEELTERVNRFAASIRYAGPTILAELWGWAHLDEWPLYHQRAVMALRQLGWPAPSNDYAAFARIVRDLRTFYEEGERVAPRLPLYLELDQFLLWVTATDLAPATPTAPRTVSAGEDDSQAPTPADAPLPAPPLVYEGGEVKRRRAHAVREFGASYGTTPAPLHTWPDRPLTPPSTAQLARAEHAIRQELALPDDLIMRITGHLLAGRHVVLTGVPGTGKSHLATLLATELFGYYPLLVTANAEWSSFDVVGGLVPVADERGTLRYAVRPGVVYEALRRNWWLAEDGTVMHSPEGQPLRASATHADQQWPGVWLIVDELNRADVDKAFGDLFTALESGQLRVPRVGTEASLLIPFPRDFRIIATLNSRDRHFLFTLSDALKRRFAFVEVTAPAEATERTIVTRRTEAALSASGLAVSAEFVAQAVEALYPVVGLLRAFAPLGTAPVLAALRYVGAVQTLGERPLNEALQEAVLAEILPQYEGLRRLPLTLLARLLAGQPTAALDALEESISQSYGDDQPLLALHALVGLVNVPALQEQTTRLLNSPATDPAAIQRALNVLAELRTHTSTLPAPSWPRVSALLRAWLAER